MILRIQSLFLLCAAVVTSLMLFMPAATLFAPDGHLYDFYTGKVVQIALAEPVTRNWDTLILNLAVFHLAFITIFARKRKAANARLSLLLKLRLCVAGLVLQAGLFGLVWWRLHSLAAQTGAVCSPRLSFVFPLVGMVFTALAVRAVTKDIVLLKSFDRIR